MSSLIQEELIFTVPDPSVLRPKVDTIEVENIECTNLTVTGTVSIASITITGTITLVGTTTTVIENPNLSAQTVGAVTVSMLTYAMPLDTISTIECIVSAITAAGETASIKATVRCKNIGGAGSVGSTFDFYSNPDAALTGIAVSFTLAGTDVDINAVGVAGETIRFSGVAKIVRTIFS